MDRKKQERRVGRNQLPKGAYILNKRLAPRVQQYLNQFRIGHKPDVEEVVSHLQTRYRDLQDASKSDSSDEDKDSIAKSLGTSSDSEFSLEDDPLMETNLMNQSMQTMYKVKGSKDEREDNNLVTVRSIQDLNKEVGRTFQGEDLFHMDCNKSTPSLDSSGQNQEMLSSKMSMSENPSPLTTLKHTNSAVRNKRKRVLIK